MGRGMREGRGPSGDSLRGREKERDRIYMDNFRSFEKDSQRCIHILIFMDM